MVMAAHLKAPSVLPVGSAMNPGQKRERGHLVYICSTAAAQATAMDAADKIDHSTTERGVGRANSAITTALVRSFTPPLVSPPILGNVKASIHRGRVRWLTGFLLARLPNQFHA